MDRSFADRVELRLRRLAEFEEVRSLHLFLQEETMAAVLEHRLCLPTRRPDRRHLDARLAQTQVERDEARRALRRATRACRIAELAEYARLAREADALAAFRTKLLAALPDDRIAELLRTAEASLRDSGTLLRVRTLRLELARIDQEVSDLAARRSLLRLEMRADRRKCRVLRKTLSVLDEIALRRWITEATADEVRVHSHLARIRAECMESRLECLRLTRQEAQLRTERRLLVLELERLTRLAPDRALRRALERTALQATAETAGDPTLAAAA